MKTDMAERLAAVETDISVEKVRDVVNAYLAALTLCSVCGGDGVLGLTRPAYATDKGVPVPLKIGSRDVEAGAELLCPACGSPDPASHAKGDPEWVVWCCVADTYSKCLDEASKGEASGANHARCGWRVTVPLAAQPGE